MTSSPPSQHNTPRQGNFAVHSNFYSLANYNEEENSNNNMNKRPKSSPRSSPASSSISRNGGNNHHQFRNHSINSNSSSTNSSYFSKNIMTKRNSSPATTRPSTTDSKTGQHIYSSKTVRKKYPIGESAQKTKEENKRELEKILGIQQQKNGGVCGDQEETKNTTLDDLATDKIFKPRLPNSFFELTETALAFERPPPPPSDDEVIDTSKEFGVNRKIIPKQQRQLVQIKTTEDDNDAFGNEFQDEDVEEEEPQLLVTNENFSANSTVNGNNNNLLNFAIPTNNVPQQELKIPRPPSLSASQNNNNNNQNQSNNNLNQNHHLSVFGSGSASKMNFSQNTNNSFSSLKRTNTTVFFQDQKESKKDRSKFMASFRIHNQRNQSIAPEDAAAIASLRRKSSATMQQHDSSNNNKKNNTNTVNNEDSDLVFTEPLSFTNATFPGISDDGTRVLPHSQVNPERRRSSLFSSTSDKDDGNDENHKDKNHSKKNKNEQNKNNVVPSTTTDDQQEDSDIMITDCIYKTAEDLPVPSKGTKKLMQQFAMKPFAREMTVALFWTVVLKLQTSESWIIEQERIAKMSGGTTSSPSNTNTATTTQYY